MIPGVNVLLELLDDLLAVLLQCGHLDRRRVPHLNRIAEIDLNRGVRYTVSSHYLHSSIAQLVERLHCRTGFFRKPLDAMFLFVHLVDDHLFANLIERLDQSQFAPPFP